MPQDWNDQQRRGWDDNRSFDDRQGRAGSMPSQYEGMGGSSTRNIDAHRLADARHDDMDQFDHSRGRWNAPGADFGRGQIAGQGGQLSSFGERYQDGTGPQLGGRSDQGLQHGGGHGQDHLYEENYRNWRAEQMRRFDQDYHEFRQHRQSRFDEEFDEWRKSRGGAGSASTSHSGSQSGGTGEQTTGES